MVTSCTCSLPDERGKLRQDLLGAFFGKEMATVDRAAPEIVGLIAPNGGHVVRRSYSENAVSLIAPAVPLHSSKVQRR
jgi:hypothetical protein